MVAQSHPIFLTYACHLFCEAIGCQQQLSSVPVLGQPICLQAIPEGCIVILQLLYLQDLSRLGRDLDKVVIVDNSPASYIFHPDNAVSLSATFTLYKAAS